MNDFLKWMTFLQAIIAGLIGSFLYNMIQKYYNNPEPEGFLKQIIDAHHLGTICAYMSWGIFVIVYILYSYYENTNPRNDIERRKIGKMNFYFTTYIFGPLSLAIYFSIHIIEKQSEFFIPYVGTNPAYTLLIGLVLSMFGLSLIITGRVHLDGYWGAYLFEYSNGNRLVQTGPYQFIRHPIYAGQIWLAIATTILSNCWLTLLFPLTLWFANQFRARTEDIHLKKEFTDEYKEYEDSTHFYLLIPRFLFRVKG